MEFLFLWHTFPRSDRGDSIPVVALIKHLHQRGHKVHLVTYEGRSNPDDDLTSFLESLVVISRKHDSREDLVPILFERLTLAVRHPMFGLKYLMSYHYSLELEDAVNRFLEGHNEIDAVVCSAGTANALSKSAENLPRIVMPLDSLADGYYDMIRSPVPLNRKLGLSILLMKSISGCCSFFGGSVSLLALSFGSSKYRQYLSTTCRVIG